MCNQSDPYGGNSLAAKSFLIDFKYLLNWKFIVFLNKVLLAFNIMVNEETIELREYFKIVLNEISLQVSWNLDTNDLRFVRKYLGLMYLIIVSLFNGDLMHPIFIIQNDLNTWLFHLYL